MKKLCVGAIFLTAAILLSIYSIVAFDEKQYVWPSEYLQNPKAYAGQRGMLRGGIIQAEQGGFVFNLDGQVMKVEYDKPVRNSVFGTVTVDGVYGEDGVFKATDVINLDYNNWKYIISFVGLGMVIFFLLREWKLRIPLEDKNA
ncbi:MAG: hypothetical protein V1837_06385 [Candidatus Woesearchaeota archaeon]